ncbi:MAG: acetyl-CoA carboxylase biotin carboxyl carrier protein [Roseofilum sp. SBFL]|uniref:acetyl-CoA carboxylase biotin carboxyl carrier protein n=1 Tax=unclassified Roseofilum TaxID=2620099 RepID=UPI001B1068CD|nr:MULTISPECIES: acetyl-CoA carboxylase biotin carboxyl carrier protein [unclassified Roseofilum]MBP0012312.1 acetyl-CoA carboxylase biotin carboxyl carrier protein [Roseofilum sp. SID3]MBP0022752.1 acetyl-CoA carboxylase biotin carboxyl carrier protein [Roseofilum sp. SID2]MBP0037051.1 acetyl-CoA carboxylase biotin carboxyl carrier protein [Roseofilum sp. SID1]MBP0041455.1 acetyl-CoA carboxylase biotin carboxyl carrier protein [Roseofilum sp. SBFL]
MNLNFDELRELIITVSQTDVAELTLKSDAFELTVRKGETGTVTNVSQIAVSPPVVQTAVAPPTPSSPAAPPTSEASPPPLEQKLEEIKSPMVGTFYRAPTPDDAPFTEVGDRVQVGDTVCIIEAMKLMNELEAEVSGEVVEILVENAQPIEFGQVLMRVKPN